MPKNPTTIHPPKSGKPPRKPSKASGSRAAALRQASKEEEIGDTADQIMRAPKKKKR